MHEKVVVVVVVVKDGEGPGGEPDSTRYDNK